MNNADTKLMIDLVERQTGYRVTVDVVSGIYEHAQMTSARPEAPAHVIRVSADCRQYADYIVAVQCGMLLVLWSDSTRVPGMAFEKAKCDYLAGKWSKTRQLAPLPADVATKTANFYVEGLLKQLNSTPLEIRVANLCFETCPSLHEMQAESYNAYLRGLSEVFSPKVKDQAPQDIFQMNVAMNAALALNWARLSGSRLALLPYESTGHVGAGQKLLDAVDAAPEQTSENHMRAVNAWAEQLSLRSLYRWDGAEQVFDIGQLRLRFSVTKQDGPAVNVRFDPWTARFSGFEFEFTWSELMFKPEGCLVKLFSS